MNRSWQHNRSFVLLLLASSPLLLFLSIPLLALILRITPAELLITLLSPQVAQAIALSMSTTLTTLCIAVIAGTPLGFLLARYRFPGYTLVDTLVDLPLILPPAVAGIALLMAFGRRGLIGSTLADLGIEIAFTRTAVIMAQCFVAIPFYVKSAKSGFGSVNRTLEQAARLDGASTLQTFRFITVPLSWGILLTGMIMTWARAMGEFGATIIFAGNYPGRTQTMPLAIYLGFELDLQIALTLSVILMTISFGVLFVVKRVLGKNVNIY
jgi:molybdate transport system permease protein